MLEVKKLVNVQCQFKKTIGFVPARTRSVSLTEPVDSAVTKHCDFGHLLINTGPLITHISWQLMSNDTGACVHACLHALTRSPQEEEDGDPVDPEQHEPHEGPDRLQHQQWEVDEHFARHVEQ